MLPQDRLESIQILRGIAALLVVMFHLTNGVPGFLPPQNPVHLVCHYGYVGVEMFFVISGCVIPLSMVHENYTVSQKAGPYFLKRILRIEPPYFASILLAEVLLYISTRTAIYHGPPFPRNIVGIVALHMAYLAPWFGIDWLNSVYWTLAIEFQYYLFMLVSAHLLIKAPWWKSRAFLMSAYLLSVAVPDQRALFHWLPFFAFGFVAFLVRRKEMSWGEALVHLTICAGLSIYNAGDAEAIAAICAFGFIFLPVRRRIRYLSFLGTISYSLYLTHLPVGMRVINLATRLPYNLSYRFGAIGLAAFVSILFAYVFWRWIEAPSITLSKRVDPPSAQTASG
jgi:peptidoglycan/LPS O-acetylase OafA/YrhL